MDRKSLDEIMSEREVPVETVEQPQTETTDTAARDDKGRFAPKDGQAPETIAAAPIEHEPAQGQVPQQALHASREREKEAKQEAEQLRQQLAQMQGQITLLAQQRQQPATPAEPAKSPDFWEDPNGYVKTALDPIQQQVQQTREQFSQMLAVEKFGQEAVNAAFQALGQGMQTDPSLRADHQRIMASPHPYGELVNWHKRRQAEAEIGLDPTAYKEKLRAEIMAELQANQANPAPAAKPVMPTSFSAARSEGPRTQVAFSGPKPLSEIMDR